MGYYLLEHRNPHGDHFYRTRHGQVLAIVVHITAGLEDLDAVDDHSAERTAAYAASTDRAVSWHSGSDSDTVVELLPAHMTAFHVQGYNSVTFGHEISKAVPDWRRSPGPWVDATLRTAAGYLGPRARSLSVPIRKATKAELDRARSSGGAPVGFIGHHELDPKRRSDPGRVGDVDTFPWDRFLALAAGPVAQPPEVAPMFDPPLVSIVDALPAPHGGCWLLAADGAIYTTGPAPYLGGMNDEKNALAFVFRRAARLEPYQGGYRIVATSGEKYVPAR